MALYEEAMIKQILGLATYAHDWKVGLYVSGIDPVTSLATAEIASTRLALPTMTWNAGTTSLVSTADLLWGPLDALSVGGWFVVNGAETKIAWYAPFTTPVVTTLGDYLLLAAGGLTLGMT